MPQTDAAGRAAAVSALKQALHLVDSHASPGRAKHATLEWLAKEIATLSGGRVFACVRCARPVVVTDPVAPDRVVQCHRCKHALRRAAIMRGERPSSVR